jgi:ATP-dependent Clp protease ATP-binding subunit ClpC
VKASIPVYVEESRQEDGRPLFTVQALFHPDLQRRGELADRALMRLAQDLRIAASRLSAQPRHDELLALLRSPDLAERMVDLAIDLRRGTARVRALVVSYRWNGRQLAFSPSLPELWFEVPVGASVEQRALEVYTEHFRKKERDLPGQVAAAHGPDRRAWLAWIDVEVARPRPRGEDADPRKRAISSLERLSGELELMQVGTCLSWGDTDEMDRAIGREPEIAELERMLAADERRPILLVGPRSAGKTALLLEYVRRAKLRPPGPTHRVLWHLAPERLISGMSFVGQWEQRLLAILATAARKDLVLCFDDVLGLYSAGVCASSDLSVAHVLRARVEQRRVRLVAEMTPEELRVLRERDRGFADLFHVIPVRETTQDETLAILVGLMRNLEARHRCRFALDTVPAVLDLSSRHARDVAFPGKAAAFLRQLAVKHAHGGAEIGRDLAHAEFAARSGLAVAFVDGRVTTRRAAVVTELVQLVVGQTAAVDAMADAVAIARARLADPGRPLASLLFLGPTGVGKTQCARALASYLFGDPARLVRIDMNELVGPGAAMRLVGTFHQPDGLLTAAVRRQPFCVLLLDEIEKAHPDVLDLLLQVLGDGRLTDGRGRTTDFGSTIVVMTSNLGAREAAQHLGFAADARDRADVYRRAAERFFRPELFNRIDRVVPFGTLTRADMEEVARGLIDGVLARGGLAQRRCQLAVEPDAMERIVDAGFHPELGARALKRAIETQLTRPVADRLASMPAGAPTFIRVRGGPDGLLVEADALTVRAPEPWTPRTGRVSSNIEELDAKLARLEEELAGLAPEGELEAGAISPAQLSYLTMRDQAQRAGRLRDMLAGRAASRGGRSAPARPPRVRPVRRLVDGGESWREVLVAGDPVQALGELANRARRYGETLEDRVDELAGEVGLLARMLRATREGEPSRAEFEIRTISGKDRLLDKPRWDTRLTVGTVLSGAFQGWTGLTVIEPPEGADAVPAVALEGPAALALARLEAGIHVFYGLGEGPILTEVRVRGDAVAARGLAPIVRCYAHSAVGDVATGLMLPWWPKPEELRRIVVARLEREA